MKFGLFWVAMAPFGLETGPNESKWLQKPRGPPLHQFWTNFGSILDRFGILEQLMLGIKSRPQSVQKFVLKAIEILIDLGIDF